MLIMLNFLVSWKYADFLLLKDSSFLGTTHSGNGVLFFFFFFF